MKTCSCSTFSTWKLQKQMVFQHFQFKSLKNKRFFNVFWFREASVSQSGPDRALGKLAEDLYQRKLLIKRDLESLLDFWWKKFTINRLSGRCKSSGCPRRVDGGPEQRAVVAFPGLCPDCSSCFFLRILGVKKESRSFSSLSRWPQSFKNHMFFNMST